MKKTKAIVLGLSLLGFTSIIIYSCSKSETSTSSTTGAVTDTSRSTSTSTSTSTTTTGTSTGTATGGWQNFITESFWNSTFPKRAGVGYKDQGYTTDFYSFQNLKDAISELQKYKLIIYTQGTARKTVRVTLATGAQVVVEKSSWFVDANTSTSKEVLFTNFLNGSNDANNKRELCAFLANISKETNGGWTGPGDGGEGDRAKWGLTFVYESGHQKTNCNLAGYRDNSETFQPAVGKCYHGRGPIQTSYAYNYGPLSIIAFGEANTLINDPDQVSENGKLAFMAGIVFWMSPRDNKPSCNEAMQETWSGIGKYTNAKMLKKGFAHTNNIINGGLECRNTSAAAFAEKPALRSKLYKYYLKQFGFSDADIEKEDAGDYTTLCYENGSAMTDY